jgi:glutathione transport system ATP-binding protein
MHVNVTTPLLSVRGLTVSFGKKDRRTTAVRDLDFDLAPGTTMAIVGESGSGKSVTALAAMGLTPFSGGQIDAGAMNFTLSDGRVVDLTKLSEKEMRRIRGEEIAIIFQEPMTSLNPVLTIGDQIAETIAAHREVTAAEARQEACRLLEKVRLPDAETMLDRYPHQLSGGMRQRVMIAMALSCRPRLLIADEPTTALDVTVQAQILNIIRELQQETGMAVIFITHDMGVVAEIADTVLLLWRGDKVEEGPVDRIFAAPQKPYTKMLLSAVPRLGSLAAQPLPLRLPITVMEGGEPKLVGGTHVQDTAIYKDPILRLDRLSARFGVRHDVLGRVTHNIHAAEAVSLDLYPGETLAIVGESGSGKSTVGRMIQQLVRPSSGNILFEGRAYAGMSPKERQQLSRYIHSIFQDPMASLNPRRTVGASIAEPIEIHGLIKDRAAIRDRVGSLLEKVGLRRDQAELYPHQFSGGQRQRICIARALASEPRVVIADESVSALDVSIQAQIIQLLMELQAETGLSYVFISHDMAVVEKMSHRVAVMYLGQIVEYGPRQSVINNPQHPYTQRLLSAVPVAETGRSIDRRLMSGEIPSPMRRVGDDPVLVQLREVAPKHFVAEH